MSKQTIGEFIATLRKAKGLTQQQVADRLGISNRTLSSWEQGRSYPDILTLPALSEILGVTVDELVSGERKVGEDAISPQLSEKAQKNLLKNTINKYSLKCTVLTAVGICGIIFIFLGLIMMFGVSIIAGIVFFILAIIDPIVIFILLVFFEKAALIVEEEKSRYSLVIKQMTYGVAFKICLCYIIASMLTCLILGCVVLGRGNISVAAITGLLLLIPTGIMVGVLIRLSERGSEFYTDSDRETKKKNVILARKLVVICAAVSVAFAIVFSSLSFVTFTHKDNLLKLSEDEFIRKVQTCELSGLFLGFDFTVTDEDGSKIDSIFIDVPSVLSAEPVDREVFNKNDALYYKINDNFFLRTYFYEDDYKFGLCYSGETGDAEKEFEYLFVADGEVLFVGGRESYSKKYHWTEADIISAINNRDLFVCFDSYIVSELNTMEWSASATYHYQEVYVEKDGGYYSVIRKTHSGYGVLFGRILLLSIFVSIGVCYLVYCAKRIRLRIDY